APKDSTTMSNNAVWDSAGDVTPDMACAPWTLVDTATPEDPVHTGLVLDLTDDADAEDMYYTQTGADLIQPPVLVISVDMRFVSGASTSTARAPAAILWRTGPSLDKNTLFIGDGELFLMTDDATRGATFTAPTT